MFFESYMLPAFVYGGDLLATDDRSRRRAPGRKRRSGKRGEEGLCASCVATVLKSVSLMMLLVASAVK